MLQPLVLHPDSHNAAVSAVAAGAARRGGVIEFRFVLNGEVSRLALPPPAPPRRGHELWTLTCFEAFVQCGGGGYAEFNFTPALQWAAYRFDRYREGMRVAPDVREPAMELRLERDGFELSACVAAWPMLAAPARVGLSAVIAEIDGAKSYWALAHPPGKPDFHHADSFALELP